MSEVLRLFQSAADPADLDDVRRLFLEDVKPVFLGHPGCLAMELVVAPAPGPGGLLEGAAVSRWSSAQAMDSALAARDVHEALVRIRQFLRQEPVIRVLDVLA